MKKILTVILTVIFILAMSVASFASVFFDSGTGTGFVGKGDVQLALGYNNKIMQEKANGLTFTYEINAKYAVTEEWVTEGKKEIKVHEVTKKTSHIVNNTIAYDPRVRNQVTGFYLLGYSSKEATGTIPIVGETITVDPQTGNPYPTDHVVTKVELLESTSGLYVNGQLLQQ